MSPRRLRFTLSLLQLATFATLVRSVAFDRWITVAASVLLLIAAFAAQRGRTWGVALSFALGVTFAAICGLGIAPLWFGVVAFLAMRPFVRLFRDFTRFDRGATAVLTVLASGIGVLGAVAWKEFAFDLFRAFPSLIPSAYPHHGPVLLGLIAAGIFGSRLVRDSAERADASASSSSSSSDDAEHADEVESRRIRVSATDSHGDEDRAALEELESELREPLDLEQQRLRR